jgi:hypothetical protein
MSGEPRCVPIGTRSQRTHLHRCRGGKKSTGGSELPYNNSVSQREKLIRDVQDLPEESLGTVIDLVAILKAGKAGGQPSDVDLSSLVDPEEMDVSAWMPSQRKAISSGG